MLLNFNLNHIVTFVVVADEASFRTAAERLNISQSVISSRIKQLEDRLGVPLLHRTTRWVSLTSEGERLLTVAKSVLADLERVAAELKEEASLQRGAVTVGVMPTIAASILPGAIARFRARHPNIDIKIVDVDSRRILELMRYGAAELGIISDEEGGKNIEFTPLFWDECFFVVSKDHPLARKREVRLAELSQCALLLSPKGSRFRDMVENCFAEHGLTPAPAQEGWHMQTLAALVEQGVGGAIMPHSALQLANAERCKVLRVRERIGRTVGVARVSNRSESPATAAFRRFLVDQLSAEMEPQLIG